MLKAHSPESFRNVLTMRVLQVTDYFWPATEWGGPVTCIRQLAEALANSRIEVEVVTTTTRGSNHEAPIEPGRRRVGGVEVAYFDALGPRRYFGAPGMVQFAASNVRRFDVIHLNGLWSFPVATFAAAARIARVPYVLTAHGMLDPWALAQRARKKELYMRLIAGPVLRNAAFLHFTAEAERRLVPEEIRALPSVIIPNVVDASDFADIPENHTAPPPLQLLVVGRIHPKKGFDILIPALGELVGAGVNAVLEVAGPDEGGYQKRVGELVRQHGVAESVRFLGNLDRPSLARALERCHMLVMPSYQENFGLAAAEAMAAGRPVIVSDTVNIQNDIKKADAGRVVRLGVGALVATIRELAASSELRARLGSNGRRLVRERYRPEAVAKQMLAAYKRAASERFR